jgi:hypothetical protein
MASKILQVARYAANTMLPAIQSKLVVNGVDYSSALKALAISAAKGSEPLTGGAGLTGHHMSLQRVGRAFTKLGNPNAAFERVGQMEWFGSRNAVYATVDRKLLLNPDTDIMKWGRLYFTESERCRPEEYDHILSTSRGFFELFNLGLTLNNTFDNKTGEFFPTRGNKYLKQLVQLFDKDENLASFKLLSDFDKAGLLY